MHVALQGVWPSTIGQQQVMSKARTVLEGPAPCLLPDNGRVHCPLQAAHSRV